MSLQYNSARTQVGGNTRDMPMMPVAFTGAVQSAQTGLLRFQGKKQKPAFAPVHASPTSPKMLQPDLFAPLLQTEALKRFAVIGDAGNGLKPQFDIARQMLRTLKDKPFASVLVLGDNVYNNGEPEHFKQAIKRPYQQLMKAGVRFYPVMGNHDVRGGFGAQQQAYWGAPSFYSRRLGNVEVFAMDTTVFLPGYDGCYQDNPFLALQQAKDQLLWLDKALAASDAKYKVVYGHYPLYSSGMHATKLDATIKLREVLEPLLVKHRVDAYLAGHEHHYEKSVPIQGIRHFVSGSAGQLRPNVSYRDNPPYPRERLVVKYHFMLFEETPQGLKYQAISRKDNVLDEGLLPPKRFTQIRFA